VSAGGALDSLTPAEMEQLRACLPTRADVMLGWARPVLAAPEGERATLVAAQLEVLEALWADPEAWCRQALELALAERGARRG